MTIPTEDHSAILSALGGLLGGGTILYTVGRLILRRTVRDGLENAKDRAETDFVQSLMNHNNSLREEIQSMATERNGALAANGKLEAMLESKTEQVHEAHEEIARLRNQIQHLMYPPHAGSGAEHDTNGHR